MAIEGQQARLAALAALLKPVDQDCFDLVARAPGAVGRDEAAAALGLPRAAAAFRLDKLVASGLLTTEYRRLSGRAGPGAGRPAKLYRLASPEVTASVPERHYELAADLLAEAVERAGEGVPLDEALVTVAMRHGIEIGRAAPSLDAALESGGYRPEAHDGETRLANCPFRRLAAGHSGTICALNQALLGGVLEGTGADPARAGLAPDDAGCCVRIRAAG